jgi:transposase
MLEGDERNRWYLWCFSSASSCFFECHDTRAGEVAADVLIESSCRAFVSDAYSGYGKAIRDANGVRQSRGQLPVVEVFCNAHARRGFHESQESFPKESQFFIDEYEKIYNIEKQIKKLPGEGQILRGKMSGHFEAMQAKAKDSINNYSSHSSYYKACQYLLNRYPGLTVCIGDPAIPLDNNQSERQLRSPVVGRKTWYGTHSKDGALAAAVHFTIIESCKLIGANPREYYREIIKAIHYKEALFTPSEFAMKKRGVPQALG